jgi:hypothetical protein
LKYAEFTCINEPEVIHLDILVKLFEVALYVESPIFIDSIEFDKGEGELHIHMDFKCGGRFDGPIFGEQICPAPSKQRSAVRIESLLMAALPL